MLKSKRGITLVALIITIIVLLILAAVSINLILGDNGVLQKSKSSKLATEIAQEKEQMGLSYSALRAKKLAQEDTSAITGAELNVQLQEDGVNATAEGDNPIVVTFTDSGRSYEIDSFGNVIDNNNSQSGGDSSQLGEEDDEDSLQELYLQAFNKTPEPNAFLYAIKDNGKAKIIGYNYPGIWECATTYELYRTNEYYDEEENYISEIEVYETGSLNDGYRYHAGVHGGDGDCNIYYAFNTIPKKYEVDRLDGGGMNYGTWGSINWYYWYDDSEYEYGWYGPYSANNVEYVEGTDYYVYNLLDKYDGEEYDENDNWIHMSGSIVNTCSFFNHGTIIPETVKLKVSDYDSNIYVYDATGTNYTIDEVERNSTCGL